MPPYQQINRTIPIAVATEYKSTSVQKSDDYSKLQKQYYELTEIVEDILSYLNKYGYSFTFLGSVYTLYEGEEVVDTFLSLQQAIKKAFSLLDGENND